MIVVHPSILLSCLTHNKLDKPVWLFLNEIHAKFLLSYGSLKCYQPGCCPFGRFKNKNRISKQTDACAKLIDHFFIGGEQSDWLLKINLNEDVSVKFEITG